MISVKIAKIDEPVQEDEDVLVDVETFSNIAGVYILAESIDAFHLNPVEVGYRLISVGGNHDFFIHYMKKGTGAVIRLSSVRGFDTGMFYNTGEQVYFNVGE